MRKSWLAVLFTILLLVSTVTTSVFFKYQPYIRIGACLLATIGFCFAFYIIIGFKEIKKIHSRKIRLLDGSVILWFIYILIHYTLSPVYNQILENLMILLSCLGFYFIIRVLLRSNREKIQKTILLIIILFGVLQSLYSLCQLFSILPNNFSYYKMGGTYGNPGNLANVLVVSYASSLAYFLHSKSRKLKKYLSGAAFLILTTIILLNARTAWVAVGIITIYTFNGTILKQIKRLKNKISLTKFYVIIISILIIFSFLSFRLYQYKQASADGRLFIYKLCIELIKERPVFGHGYDSFVPVYSVKQANYFSNNPGDLKQGLLADDNLFAFNDYLQLSIENGLFGLILFLLPIVLIFSNSLTKEYTKNNDFKLVTSPVLGILVCMQFSYPLQNATILLILFLLLALFSSSSSKILFEFRLCNLHNKLLKTSALILFSVILGTSVLFIHAGFMWEKHLNKQISINNYRNEYIEQMYLLKHDKGFLFHYGGLLFSSGDYIECIEHIEHYNRILNDSKSLMFLAESYEQVGINEKAEENYLKASNIKPHLFVPKYKLFKLYCEDNKPKEAYKIALEIQSQPIKAFSTKVGNIKATINQYIEQGQECYTYEEGDF